jgi:type I restriction enzyme S subunit
VRRDQVHALLRQPGVERVVVERLVADHARGRRGRQYEVKQPLHAAALVNVRGGRVDRHRQPAGIDLAIGCQCKAAGRFDAEIHKLESLVGKQDWFTTHKRERFGYRYQPGDEIDDRVGVGGRLLGNRRNEMERLFDLFARMKAEQAESFAAVFAAWNDFLLDAQQPSEDDIIREIRENWHEAKECFAPARIKRCIDWIRREHFVPRGVGLRTLSKLCVP